MLEALALAEEEVVEGGVWGGVTSWEYSSKSNDLSRLTGYMKLSEEELREEGEAEGEAVGFKWSNEGNGEDWNIASPY